MSGTWLKMVKLCVTCEFWGGARKPNPDKNVYVDSGALGICTLAKSPLKGTQRKQNDPTCHLYEKWTKIK
jgi:hypothetical protein